MDVTETAEQQEICAVAERLLMQRAGPAQARALATDARGYDAALWREMAELGWLAMALPEAHDGLGLSFVELGLLIEVQGRHLLTSPFVPTVAVAAQALARFGSAAQQAAHLPAIASGERVIAVAHGGPGGDWSPGAVEVKVKREASGYRLEGSASFVHHAQAADVLLVVAEEAPGKLSVLLVPAGAEGVTMRRLQTAPTVHAARIDFAGAQVGEDAVLGSKGGGEAIARALLSWGAAARCAELCGLGQRVLDMTVEYAKERVAFGKPIGALQAIQHHCANIAVDVLSSRGVTREALWRVATDDARATEAVSTAKSWASDAISRACALGHQVHGAIGFTAEHDLHLFSQRVHAAELDYGDGAFHRDLLARAHEL